MHAPATIVLFGVTGDLSKRKLLPSLARLAAEGALPEPCRIVGVSRRSNVDLEALLANVEHADRLRERLELFTMDMSQAADFGRLAVRLREIDQENPVAQRLFFLSVPPEGNAAIISGLGSSGLSKAGNAKLLVEKPFGTDLESAQVLIRQVAQTFSEGQTYRIDHYLAKQTARALTAFRSAHPDVEALWNKDMIARVDILAAETLDIEGRADFYEQTGALVDFAQNHLFELAALTLADISDTDAGQARARAMAALRVDVDRSVRGQYEGYREEAKNPASNRETFVSLAATSNDPRWTGVPIRLTTGKALDKKASEIRLFFQGREDRPGLVWPLQDGGVPAIDPSLDLAGPFGAIVRAVSTWKPSGTAPHAYGTVFTDALQSKKDAFVSSEEVLASWTALKPLQELWKTSGEELFLYPKGSIPDAIE